LHAGAAGDRPEGVAEGPAGHGATGYEVRDRASQPTAPLTPDGRVLHDRFVAAIDDDLDMPGALALLREILQAPLSAEERRWLILDADAVLGLDLHRVWEGAPEREDAPPDEVADKLAARQAARAAADYPTADRIRSEIEALGWEVIDGPGGSQVRHRS
jgi:cysteinyl-tRNA synthetase